MDTLLVVVLDESGSMHSCKKDVIGGFNGLVADRANEIGKTRILLTTFSNECRVFFPEPIPSTRVPSLTESTYSPGGGTALSDATYKSIELAKKHQQEGERVLVVIITDGEENSSKHHTLKDVKNLINEVKSSGWTVTYLGTAPKDAAETGIVSTNTATYAGGQSFNLLRTATTAYMCSNVQSTPTFYSGVDNDNMTWHI